MTAPRIQFRKNVGLVQTYLGEVNSIAEQAAKVDQSGKWGVDGWITLIHNLIDLQMRTSATVMQVAMAGPMPWLQPVDREPWLSEDVEVDEKPYPRTLTIIKSFTRVGRSDVTIPDAAIAFFPPVLMPGGKLFQVDLTDSNFVGANYSATIGLTPVGPVASASPAQQQISVTLGL